ncbi:hypothetical protein [Niastella vici]|nr:hypothetical protein [Niastella vici]
MNNIQSNLFYEIKQPLIAACGLGVDTVAYLVEMKSRNIKPDAILFADVGVEKDETYSYLPILQDWLNKVGFPPVITVKYVAKDFKNRPPYHTIGEDCLTNGTLPSLAFGFKSCSLKWKVTPQNKWLEEYIPAIDWWNAGGKVKKIIGYDTSPKDMKRYAVAKEFIDPKYEYWYPLVEWGMTRNDCKNKIRSEGLPVPPKSACIFCPSTQPEELLEYKKKYLRYIVIMEARAEPKLTSILGLWRNGIKGTKNGKPKPGRMTDFIIAEGLLSENEVNDLRQKAPIEIINNQAKFADGLEIPDWHDFLELFTEEDAVESIHPCSGCIANNFPPPFHKSSK